MALANAVQCPTGDWAWLAKVCNPTDVHTAVDRTCVTLIDAIKLDDNPTSYTSTCTDVSAYDYGMLFLDIAVNGAPTDVLFELYTGCADNACTYKIMDGPLGDLRYDDTCCPRVESIAIPYFCDYLSVKATATGTDADKYFTVTAKVCLVKNSY